MGEKCCFCEKIGNSLLKCSACGCVSYCNQNCQKSDWKKHKKNCCSYKLVEVPGKDFGLVAVRKIKQGETLMKDSPLLIQSKNLTEMKKGPSLLEQFENLSKSSQTNLLNLYHENPRDTLANRIQAIYVANACDVTATNATALYQTIPRMNHSCSPNVVWSWKDRSPYIKEVRAVGDVEAGEELCTNYIDSFEATFSSTQDRQHLLQRWKFVCQCEVCSLPEDKKNENDLLRRKIALQHQLIPKYMANWKIEKAMEAAKIKVQLMKSIESQMMTTLPSAILEMYEMCRLGLVLNTLVEDECEDLLKQAKERSEKLGDRFVHVFQQKVEQIEEECIEVALARKRTK